MCNPKMKIMEKKITLALFLITFSGANAQIDVSTALSQKAFDATGQKSNEITANENSGITPPVARVDILSDGTIAPIRARDMQVSNVATYVNKQTLQPVVIDNNGVMVKKFSPVYLNNSYSFDGEILITPGGSAQTVVTNIYGIVIFKFVTNFSFGNSNSSMLYGQVSFSEKKGFQIAADWNYSGNTNTSDVTLVGLGTHTLTFDYVSDPDLILHYDSAASTITVSKTAGGVVTGFIVFDGMKIR